MSATASGTRVIRVQIEEKHPGLFFATSPDLQGLFVAKESRLAAYAAVPDTIRRLYQACGEPVIVEAVGTDQDGREWVAMPVPAAEAALARYRQQV